MQSATHAEIVALLRSALHFTAALVIVWCFYRLANGQMTLL